MFPCLHLVLNFSLLSFLPIFTPFLEKSWILFLADVYEVKTAPLSFLYWLKGCSLPSLSVISIEVVTSIAAAKEPPNRSVWTWLSMVERVSTPTFFGKKSYCPWNLIIYVKIQIFSLLGKQRCEFKLVPLKRS